MKFLLQIFFIFFFLKTDAQSYRAFNDSVLGHQQEEKIKTLKVKKITLESFNDSKYTNSNRPYIRAIFEYNKDSKIFKKENQSHNSSYITTSKYNKNNKLTNKYFSRKKRNYKIKSPSARLLNSKLPNSIDPDRKEYIYDYKDRLLLKEKSCEKSKCEIKTYEYDGNRIIINKKDINDKLKSSKIEEKSSNKKTLTILNELGQTLERTVYLYDSNNNIIEIKDFSYGRSNQQIKYIFKDINVLTQQIQKIYFKDNQTKKTSITKYITNYTYNNDNLLDTKSKNQDVEKYYYYKNGLIKHVKHYMSNKLHRTDTYKYEMW